MAKRTGLDRDAALRELAKRYAREDYLSYFQYVWWMPRPLRLGRHTIAISNRLTQAINDLREGRSTYLMINTPHRHGKTDLVSRGLPGFFLGRCADLQPSIIMSGYGANLVEGFSRKAQNIMQSPRYGELFPDVKLDDRNASVKSWSVAGSAGSVSVAGLGGAITGRGGNLIVLDDYCKNHEEAYSDTLREKLWNSFSSDLMTRQDPPAALVVVIATMWHPDDISGRILRAMDDDPEFPRFERMAFPMRKPGEYDLLFPEMYDESWYAGQRATLGPTMAAALLDCNPVGDGTRMFHPEWFRTFETPPPRNQMNVYIIIDSANAKRKTSDFTVMLVVGLNRDGNYYVLDGLRDRLSLSARTDALFNLVERWRPSNVFWEQVGAMSDVAHVKHVMEERNWRFPITAISQTVPKIDRVRWLQPLYEAGRVWWPNRILRITDDGKAYDLTSDFENDEFRLFPAVAHDDVIDDLANIRHPQVVAATTFPSGESRLDGRVVDDWVPFGR